jgi:hypothetical protein
MVRRFAGASLRPAHEKTHVQDGPRPERSDHSNLDPQERTPHPTVRGRRKHMVRCSVIVHGRSR